MSLQPSSNSPPDSALPCVAALGASIVPLPSPQEEARAFWRMRRRLVTTLLRQTFSRSRFRLSLIVGLSGLLWFGLFWLCVDGFDFLKVVITDPETHDHTVRAVLGMFFAALMLMLVFSSGIILYSSLFRGRDLGLLLTVPARPQRIFLHKFQEAILMSSWAFLLLGSPMLLAFGIVANVPWYYFALLLPFLMAFIYIPAAIGAVFCLCIVNWLPGRRQHVLAVAGVAAAALSVWIGWSLLKGPQSDILTPGWFQEMLRRLRLTDRRLLPSWWLSSGLLEAARGAWSESVLFLALLISNALFCRQLAIGTAGRVYRAAYSRLYGKRVSRRLTKVAWIDRAVLRSTPLLPVQMRLLIVKDLRLFRRDPVQWLQFLIFFALLFLYFINIRRFSYDVHYAGWVNMVSFLNVSVVGLLLSTFTTRFIFPMISLEGRRFWILGLLPLRRERILWSKFVFAAAGSILPCSGLILLSDLMLRVAPLIVASHQLTCVILCLGLSGIAVGIGAKLPNAREQSPSRIASGFGGTLCLVISSLYIVTVVLLTALPCHFYLTARHSRLTFLTGRLDLHGWLQFWFFAGTAASAVLGILATAIPLYMGFRAFRRMEF